MHSLSNDKLLINIIQINEVCVFSQGKMNIKNWNVQRCVKTVCIWPSEKQTPRNYLAFFFLLPWKCMWIPLDKNPTAVTINVYSFKSRSFKISNHQWISFVQYKKKIAYQVKLQLRGINEQDRSGFFFPQSIVNSSENNVICQGEENHPWTEDGRRTD